MSEKSLTNLYLNGFKTDSIDFGTDAEPLFSNAVHSEEDWKKIEKFLLESNEKSS